MCFKSVKAHGSYTIIYSNYVGRIERAFFEMEDCFTRQAAVLYNSYCLDDMLKIQKAQQNTVLTEIDVPLDLQNIVLGFATHKFVTAKITRVTHV